MEEPQGTLRPTLAELMAAVGAAEHRAEELKTVAATARRNATAARNEAVRARKALVDHMIAKARDRR